MACGYPLPATCQAAQKLRVTAERASDQLTPNCQWTLGICAERGCRSQSRKKSWSFSTPVTRRFFDSTLSTPATSAHISHVSLKVNDSASRRFPESTGFRQSQEEFPSCANTTRRGALYSQWRPGIHEPGWLPARVVRLHGACYGETERADGR